MISTVDNSNVYLIGGGQRKKLPLATEQLPSLFLPLTDKASEVVAAADAIVQVTEPFILNLIDLLDPPPGDPYAAVPIDGQWIINSKNDFALYDMATLLPPRELMQLNEFPYMLSSGSYAKIVGVPSDAWKAGTTSLYNPTTGLARKVDDGTSIWYVTLSRVIKTVTPTRPEDALNLTFDQILVSDNDYHVTDTRLNGNSQMELTDVLDQIGNTRWDIFQKLQLPMALLNWHVNSLTDPFRFGDFSSMLGSRLNSFFPSGLFNTASSLLSGALALKDSLLCFAECTINGAIDIAKEVIGAIGSIGDGSIKNKVEITMPDMETLSNCFNLSWLLDLLMGFLGMILGLLKGLWDLLKSILSWPDCSCGGSGDGDFGFDLCGFGIKTNKSAEAEEEGIGQLDLLRSYSNEPEPDPNEGVELKPRLDWDAGTQA